MKLRYDAKMKNISDLIGACRANSEEPVFLTMNRHTLRRYHAICTYVSFERGISLFLAGTSLGVQPSFPGIYTDPSTGDNQKSIFGVPVIENPFVKNNEVLCLPRSWV